MPSLTTTPSSARSSEQQILTPMIEGGIQLPTDQERGSFNIKEDNVFDVFDSDCDTASSQRHPGRRRQVAHHTTCLATPERQVIRPYDSHARSLAEVAKLSGKSRRQPKQQSLSMRSIATIIIFFQRFMKGGSGRQRKSSSHRENHAVTRTLLQETTSTVLKSKNANIASWLLQSEKSNSSCDTSSVDSLESDVTEDESEEASFLWRGEESDTHIILWERRVDPGDFIALAQRALNHLPREIVTKLLTALDALFESWRSQLAPSKHAADGDMPSSFNFSQSEGNSEHPASNSSSQKRRMVEDDAQSPDGGDNNDNNPRKRQKDFGGLDVGGRQKWACPYYQREPHRYCVETELGDFRKCAKSPGFVQVHRVKDHIYKCHSPKYCDRCYAVFRKEDELTIHRRMSPACDVKPPQPIEGLTCKQKALLKPRDRCSKSDEERWNVIYKICFPDDEVVPSPYYVHYSREIAELRREVLEIIQEEAQLPDTVDFNRLIQRVQGAFNAQLSTQTAHGFVPRTPSVLTPSTSNTSNTSGGRSSKVTTRDVYQRTPSVLRTSRLVASATRSGDTLLVSSSEELDEPSEFAITGDESSFLPFYTAHVSETNDFSASGQPQAFPVVSFRGFTARTERFDFDQDYVGEEQSDSHNFSFSPPNLDDILGL